MLDSGAVAGELGNAILTKLQEVCVNLATLTERLNAVSDVQESQATHEQRLSRLEARLDTAERLFRTALSIVAIAVSVTAIAIHH